MLAPEAQPPVCRLNMWLCLSLLLQDILQNSLPVKRVRMAVDHPQPRCELRGVTRAVPLSLPSRGTLTAPPFSFSYASLSLFLPLCFFSTLPSILPYIFLPAAPLCFTAPTHPSTQPSFHQRPFL